MIYKRLCTPLLLSFGLSLGALPSAAQIVDRCPGHSGNPGVSEIGEGAPGAKSKFQNGSYDPNTFKRNVCRSLAAGDGFVRMADGYGTVGAPNQWTGTYIFGFQDVSNYNGLGNNAAVAQIPALQNGANFAAPPIVIEEGDEFYINLTNETMFKRPDLQDPHTVHFHGFPHAAAIFDGLPESAIAVSDGSTLTYYYNVHDAGTYMYHCHVQAAEHMQMGMLGNLTVRPRQNLLPDTSLNGFPHKKGNLYAYNDGDGSTYADIEYQVQLGSLDPTFHLADLTIQHINFGLEKDVYPMLNGRGYPDTMNPAGFGGSTEINGTTYTADANGVYGLPRADVDRTGTGIPVFNTDDPFTGAPIGGPVASPQQHSTAITIPAGKKALLRISSLNTTRFFTLGSIGLPMQVVGYEARQLHDSFAPSGLPAKTFYYTTNSVTLGGGESIDVIVTAPAAGSGATVGFLYATNLDQLANNTEDFGGMMTEIRIQ